MKRLFGGMGMGTGTAALGTMLFASACGSVDRTVNAEGRPGDALRSEFAAAPAGPVVVTCQPDQRAMVRQAMVNGQPVSQVECIGGGAPAYSTGGYPVSGYTDPSGRFVQYTPAAAPAPAVSDVRVVPVSYPASQRRVVYDRAQERRAPEPTGRSWKKSAVIIGSSAGIGAGVGAAAGGKNGALIGAAIGGGGAAIWDQVTRDKTR